MSPRPRRRMLLVILGVLAVASTIGIASRSKRTAPKAEAAIDDGATRRRGAHLSLPQRGACQRRAQDRQGRTDHPRRGHSGRRAPSRRRRITSPSSDRRCRGGSCASTSAIGDQVKKGQILGGDRERRRRARRAGNTSPPRRRSAAAEANAVREKELAEKQISSNREREVADAQAVSQRAKMRAALAHLRAIGFDPREVHALEQEGAEGRSSLCGRRSAGPSSRRAVTLGQSVERSTDAFTIANLARLWVLLDIYEKDLARVHPGPAGQPAHRRSGRRGVQGAGRLRRSRHRREDADGPRAHRVRQHAAQVPPQSARHRAHHRRQRARGPSRADRSQRRRPARRRDADRVRQKARRIREARGRARDVGRRPRRGPFRAARKARRSRWRAHSCSRASCSGSACWNSIVELSVRRRGVVLVVWAPGPVAAGLAARKLSIDAVPDVTNTQVSVLTSAPGLSPVEVEKYLTFPIETAMNGIPGVSQHPLDKPHRRLGGDRGVPRRHRSRGSRGSWSTSASSWPRPTFRPATVIPSSRPCRPASARSTSSISTSDRHSPMELRTLLDWTVAYRLRSVPGVVEVNGMGGEAKQYQVVLDPRRLAGYHLSLQTRRAGARGEQRLHRRRLRRAPRRSRT